MDKDYKKVFDNLTPAELERYKEYVKKHGLTKEEIEALGLFDEGIEP